MNNQVLILCLFVSATLTVSAAVNNVTSELSEGEEVLSQWMRKLFDHHHWRGEILKNVSQDCRQHVKEYVTELRNGNPWAYKSK